LCWKGNCQVNPRKRFTKEKDLFLVSAAFVDTRAERAACCQIVIDAVDQDHDVLQRAVSGDENWCFQFNPETICQSME
jgi:hypothetical protein